jgi:hypothetical protein
VGSRLQINGSNVYDNLSTMKNKSAFKQLIGVVEQGVSISEAFVALDI